MLFAVLKLSNISRLRDCIPSAWPTRTCSSRLSMRRVLVLTSSAEPDSPSPWRQLQRSYFQLLFHLSTSCHQFQCPQDNVHPSFVDIQPVRSYKTPPISIFPLPERQPLCHEVGILALLTDSYILRSIGSKARAYWHGRWHQPSFSPHTHMEAGP